MSDQPTSSRTPSTPDPLGSPNRLEAASEDLGHYSPEPASRTDWPRSAWTHEPAGPPPSWMPPVEPRPTPESEPNGTNRPRAGTSLGVVLAASLLSAVLASGGTVAVLTAVGALGQPVATPIASPGTSTVGARQPIVVDESSAIIEAAAKVGPAVVRITSTTTPFDPFSIPTTGVGSGIIYDPNGWILTNRHVVAGASTLQVELKDGRQFEGRIYGIDTLTDLAIVKIDASGLPTAPIGDSDELKVGQRLIAIGSPLGTYSNSVTAGILSAKGRTIQVEGRRLSNLLQTDAAINPGNSGGPLIDLGGNVVGINTAVATSAEGIGFAIPINIARPIMEQAVRGQPLARPYIGVRFETIDYQVAQREKLSVQEGALLVDATDATGATVPAVEPGSPAARAGLKAGDIIVAVEGIKLDSEHPLDAVLTQFAPGETIHLEILRGSERLTVAVTLATRPEGL